ncbi:MAG: type II toxin-antitoxin system VapC family toxin [Alphaproteobacteria bacterium]|jgi:PIN domain nuclease of toxin-antitoxin system|nr:PIN domain nuclease [Rhodospirillaceae bacterium]MDP6404375.1 type II toxin-antitoxin system VapC family toxin [Alphaproteobacteria bacterium]MDP6621312.1 type II toxin-antitoxin system VapC family toxin [Alphaproteobacteria bacterium]|tara:strand:- start:27 stop:407 length:381 start_codon:yes stop_codon:yes gene_type:complete
MRLLLDTHALLWALFTPVLLSTSMRHSVLDSANDIQVSIASLWEVAIKQSIGKLTLERPLQMEVVDSGFTFLDITPEHCAAYADLPLDKQHRDPFDRMLAVQARLEGCRLVSKDAKLDRYGVMRIW